MITVAEAARRMNRSSEQVRRYLREGKLVGRRIGGQWFIDESAIDQPLNREPQIREAAVMYRPVADDKAEYRARMAAAIEAVREHREAIRKKVGDLKIDVVAMLGEDRESH